MGTFFASRRNQVVVAIVAVFFVVLAAFFLGLRGTKKIDVSTAGTATVSPSPSTSPSPSPLPDPSPSPTVVAVAPPSPVPPPSVAPSSAPPSSPTITAPALTSAGHELQAPAADETRANGGGCGLWVDAGWTLVDCNLLAIRGQTPAGYVAYVVEKKGTAPNVGWRVFLLTTRGDNSDLNWHIKLSSHDDAGIKYSNIAVKQAQVAGDSAPEVVVGFRFMGTGNILGYDIVQLRPAQALFIAASRSLDHGSANINGTELADYQPYPDAMAPSYFIRSVIRYSGGAFRIASSTHAPERGPSDFP